METNEQKQFQCTGDCLKCIAVQRQYCASQHSYDNFRMTQSLMSAVENLSSSVEDLKERLEAIQGNEALVFDPNGDMLRTPTAQIKKKAQEGDGAEE